MTLEIRFLVCFLTKGESLKENFTFQLSGTKKWTLKRSNVTTPVRGYQPHFNLKENERLQQIMTYKMQTRNLGAENPEFEVTLNPGDIFYFPSGMWHKVDAMSDSISINLSLDTTSFAQYFAQSCLALFRTNESLRSHILSSSDFRGFVLSCVSFSDIFMQQKKWKL